jgi:L-fuconolactonase
MKIDAHHHFWKYTPAEYGWIDDAMKIIRRDFLPEHLRCEIVNAGIDGVVSVQARQSLEETRWLLSLAAQHDFIKGVVGWVPLVDASLREHLAEFSKQKKFRAVRHVLQGEPDERYMLREDFNRGIAALREFGLVYDILIFERHLPQTIEFVDRHPQQTFVLDHIAKPSIKNNALKPWRANLGELARRPNVFCKVSGVVTEADYARWTDAQLRPYLDAALEAFAPERLMFGSDWPVCLVACGYARWHEVVARWSSALSKSEQEQLMGATAVKVYGI